MYLVATNINDACVEPTQCTESLGPNAECSIKQECICKPGHRFVSPPPNCTVIRGKKLLCTIRDRRRSCLDRSRRFFLVVY
jgi:hypothetical protein